MSKICYKVKVNILPEIMFEMFCFSKNFVSEFRNSHCVSRSKIFASSQQILAVKYAI